jgi:hypothetical protein
VFASRRFLCYSNIDHGGMVKELYLLMKEGDEAPKRSEILDLFGIADHQFDQVLEDLWR